MNKEKILVYAPRIASISETFIYDQIIGINNFEIKAVCNERLNKDVFNLSEEPLILGNRPVKLLDRIMSKYSRTVNNDNNFSFHFSAKEKIKKFILKNNVKLIHCHYGPSALSMLPISIKYRIPLLITFHGYDASKMLKNNNYKIELEKLFKSNPNTITVSANMQERLTSYGLNKNRNKIIPCGINLDFFNNNDNKIYTPNQPTIILHSGRITPKKGVMDLIAVFDRIQKNIENVFLWILGDSSGEHTDEYMNVKEFITSKKLENKVVLFGSQPKNKVKEIMQKADIFVLNSRVSNDGDMEGLPVSILEAMASKLPVISTYHSGIPEIIINNFNGLLVNEYDNFQLEEAILQLITNIGLRFELTENALKTVKSFSQSETVSKIEAYYHNIMYSN